MANAGFVTRFFAEFTPTTWSVIVGIGMGTIALFKVWPLIKGKINEARKIELDANADLRGDLLQRIKDLEEAQHQDRLEFYNAMGAERKRCDEEMDAIRTRLTHEVEGVRARLTATENENKGLMSAIRQNSQSTAVLFDESGNLGAEKKGSK